MIEIKNRWTDAVIASGETLAAAIANFPRTACNAARLLTQAGIVEFQVVTKKDGDRWKVAAI